MTIIFDDKLRSITYVELPGGEGNFMAAVTDEQLIYRFRYYRDNENFEKSKDKSNWYTVTGSTPDQYEKELHAMVAKIFVGLEIHEIFRGPNESIDDFRERFAKMPFVKMKFVPIPKKETP